MVAPAFSSAVQAANHVRRGLERITAHFLLSDPATPELALPDLRDLITELTTPPVLFSSIKPLLDAGVLEYLVDCFIRVTHSSAEVRTHEHMVRFRIAL